MIDMKYRFKQIGQKNSDAIRRLFTDVFTNEPWSDDWSDEEQLKLYIDDLTGQSNSLTFGMYEEDELIALSMGHIRHWYSGTEYFIDELCVSTKKQKNGIGTLFLEEIENACRELKLTHIFLLTENNVPAYDFYRKKGFNELKNNVAFAKRL